MGDLRKADGGFTATLGMQKADQWDTPLHEWVEFWIGVQGIWRHIRCFVSPSTTLPGSARSGHFSLVLGLPWLFSVNAHISIRESKVTIGDPAMGETMRDVIGPEMVFCNEHTLIMYPRKAFPDAAVDQDDTFSTSSSRSDSEDDLSEAEEMPGF